MVENFRFAWLAGLLLGSSCGPHAAIAGYLEDNALVSEMMMRTEQSWGAVEQRAVESATGRADRRGKVLVLSLEDGSKRRITNREGCTTSPWNLNAHLPGHRRRLGLWQRRRASNLVARRRRRGPRMELARRRRAARALDPVGALRAGRPDRTAVHRPARIFRPLAVLARDAAAIGRKLGDRGQLAARPAPLRPAVSATRA